MLIRENNKTKVTELSALDNGGRERVEEAARLGGISTEEAMKRKTGFRYFY